MFMQQQQGGPIGNPRVGAGPGFNPNQNVLQGPLAYLEKTTSNIGKTLNLNTFTTFHTTIFNYFIYYTFLDLVGMGDGRR